MTEAEIGPIQHGEYELRRISEILAKRHMEISVADGNRLREEEEQQPYTS
jgi:hypothetical protein